MKEVINYALVSLSSPVHQPCPLALMASLYQRQMVQPCPCKGPSPLSCCLVLPGYMEVQQGWMVHPMVKEFRKRRIVSSCLVRSVM